ncbi:unnamed protein product [Bursaphelenchus xylophilus]|uniref:(pine wood nematode) hypothetical protein n=1 Tax=Bursaphelenchus xylophilus TaxID=6326 RepID=A0A811K7N7_BURXY|nr:unnamed protein product [Bursaphelenchus xylophilus]CAG9088199.1 unnamed protein product [Bursaphelenchus xylophilus]
MFHFDGWSKPEHPGPPLDPEGLVENNGCSAGPNEPMPNKSMKEQETKVEHPSPPNEPGGRWKIKMGAHLLFRSQYVFDRTLVDRHPGPPLDPEGLVENNGCSAEPNERNEAPFRNRHRPAFATTGYNNGLISPALYVAGGATVEDSYCLDNGREPRRLTEDLAT